ncbi:MAG: hypothetical protein MJY74_03480 [Bacteroidaceae bacterium]|nr:hypothetical protein [Bacteroidaceae bacterium]
MEKTRQNAGIILAFILLLGTGLPACAAKQNATEELRQFAQNAVDFNHIFPQEKVYLQLDNSGYFQGETIWFKAFVVQASDLHRSESQVLYVELLSPSGAVLEQKKIKIVYGQCNGYFDLVDKSVNQAREMRGMLNYPSGYYEIRAYTLNMLNFDNECVFSRVIPVYNKPEKEGDFYSKTPVIKLVKSDIEQYRPPMEKLKKINVGFYPEGGSLVNGLESTVAFKATDESGNGIDVEVFPDGIGKKSVKTIHDGMGSFTVTADKKKQKIAVRYQGNDYSFNLPDAKDYGYVMHVDSRSGSFVVRADGRLEKENSDTLGLAMTLRGELSYFSQLVPEADGSVNTTVSMESMPTGVYNMVLFTKRGEVLASRMLFHRSEIALPTLSYSVEQETIDPWGKIKISFDLKDGNKIPFADRFCVSVRDAHDLGTVYSDNICTNMLLSSDLKGFIKDPNYYFQSKDKQHMTALDLLMLVQGWQRYEWSILSGVKPFKEKHRIETGLTLSGWVLDRSGKREMDGIRVNSAIVPKDRSFVDRFIYDTDKRGYFGFDVREFYGDATVTLSLTKAKNNKEANAKIKLERSLQPQIRSFSQAEMQFPTLDMIQSKYVNEKEHKLEKFSQDGLPTVIFEDGILLDEVDILGARKYVDFHTFKAHDVIKDAEAAYDRGEYTTDVFGYLLSKGYPIREIIDTASNSDSEANSESGSDSEEGAFLTSISDGETFSAITRTSNKWYLGAFKIFWYIHDSKKCIYSNTGLFEDPGIIDMEYIRSILVYDRPVAATEVLSLTPLLESGYSRDASENFAQFKSEFEATSSNYFVIDVLLKDDYEIKSRKEILTQNKRVTTMHGYSTLRDFYSPEYPTGPIMGDVDYRRTLYWNPNVITDKNGNATIEFYNNSSSRNFIINGSGMTATGMPYSLDSAF